MNNPSMEQLLAEARDAMSPSENDRERIYRSVIAASSVPDVSSPASATSTLLKVALPVFVLASAGALLMWQMPSADVSAECRKLSALTTPAVESPRLRFEKTGTIAEIREALPQAVGSQQPHRMRNAEAQNGDDSILDELRLIQQASAAVNRRAPAEAMTSLDEHRERFPRGVMSQEREGLRILALCQMNEKEKARIAHEKFLKKSPDAPVHVRINRECGF